MANPKKYGRAHMAWVRSFKKNKRGGGRKKRSSRRAKSNFYSAGAIVNRPRTHTVTRYVKVKRNPPAAARGINLFGISLPGVEPIAGAVAGLAVPPMLNYFVGGFIPPAISTHPVGRFAIQAVEIVVPSWIVRRYVSRPMGNAMLLAGLAKLAYDFIAPFLPGLSGLGFQPMLGYYPAARRGLPAMRAVPMMQTPMVSGIPERLSPSARF